MYKNLFERWNLAALVGTVIVAGALKIMQGWELLDTLLFLGTLSIVFIVGRALSLVAERKREGQWALIQAKGRGRFVYVDGFIVQGGVMAASVTLLMHLAAPNDPDPAFHFLLLWLFLGGAFAIGMNAEWRRIEALKKVTDTKPG